MAWTETISHFYLPANRLSLIAYCTNLCTLTFSEIPWASFISCTRSFWIYHMQMMAKNKEGSGIAINICITRRNVITAYLISQQHDNCWSQAKPVPGVPDKSLQSASKWRQTRLLSRWGQTLLPTRDFMGLLLKGCWWRPWHMIRVGLEQKRSQPNSNCPPPPRILWIEYLREIVIVMRKRSWELVSRTCGIRSEWRERIYLHTWFSDGCTCRWYDVTETIFTHCRPICC
jgi:hypothetical protein